MPTINLLPVPVNPVSLSDLVILSQVAQGGSNPGAELAVKATVGDVGAAMVAAEVAARVAGDAAIAATSSAAQATANAALPLASAPLMAPLRSRFTKTLGTGLAFRSFALTNTTFLHIIPIEAPCYGVRLAFANPYNVAMTVVKASVYASDSYSVLSANSNAGLKENVQGGGSIQYAVVPTGGAPANRVYFDNAGADVGTLNLAGSARSYTLPAVAANSGNANTAYTYQWSDFIPCTSIARADGGTQHLLFVYVTITCPVGWSSSNFTPGATNVNAIAPRGRYYWTGQAWNSSTDFADNPTGTGFKSYGITPLVAMQYLSSSPGIQVAITGDSLSAAPQDDNFSVPLQRAAWDLSTPSHPIEVANLAWGGTTSATYKVTLENNAAALRASVNVFQPLSRNDDYTTTGLQALFAKLIMDDDLFRQLYGAQTILKQAGCLPSSDGNAPQIAAFNDMRTRVLALGSSLGLPVIDAPGVIGNVAGSAPWDYLATYSTDNVHPNFVGAEAVVPQARAALVKIRGF